MADENPLPFLPTFRRRDEAPYPGAVLKTPHGAIGAIFQGPDHVLLYAGDTHVTHGYVAPIHVNNLPVKVQYLRFARRDGEWRWDSHGYYSVKRGDTGGPATSNQMEKVRTAITTALVEWEKTPEAKPLLKEARHAELWNEVRSKEGDVERMLDQAREAAAEVATATAALRAFEKEAA